MKGALVVLASALAVATAQAQPVHGFVDLHSHLVAEHAFGGGWFGGVIEGPIDVAVQRCDGNFPFGTHATALFPVLGELLGANPGSPFSGDTGWHLGKRRGYDRRQCKYFLGVKIPGTCPRPHFEDWPAADGIGHQQMWQGWLQQAHQGGLQVMVVSLVESNFLCSHTTLRSRRYDCDEMASVHRQAAAVHGFAQRNSSWVGIATSPADARALIAQGKLALVLSVEVTKLFPQGDFIAQLDELRALGVTSLQLTHHADNRFAGAAPIRETMKAADKVETIWGLLLLGGGGVIVGGGAIIGGVNDVTQINDIVCRDAGGNKAECNGDTVLNERGLTAEGDTLVRAMMDRGMLLDVAHASRKAIQEVYAIARERNNYPMFSSHAHPWDTIDAPHKHEKYFKADEIHMFTETGGMIGLRTGFEDTYQYNGATPIVNRCQGSSRSFAQSLLYSVDHGLKVGFGADFNGFIKQMKPRYRDDCLADKVQIDLSGGPTEMQKKGLAHVGLLPGLISDLQTLGVAAPYLEHLDGSAEAFLVMWARAASQTPCPGNVGQPCGSCGGTVQCDGSCSVTTPPTFGQACGTCGGTITCNGSCSIDPGSCLSYGGSFIWSPSTGGSYGPSSLMPGSYLGQQWNSIIATMDQSGWLFWASGCPFFTWSGSAFSCFSTGGPVPNTVKVDGLHISTGTSRSWEFYVLPP